MPPAVERVEVRQAGHAQRDPVPRLRVHGAVDRAQGLGLRGLLKLMPHTVRMVVPSENVTVA